MLTYFYSFSLFPSNETYLVGRSKTRFDPLRNQKTTGHGFFSRSKCTLLRKINNSPAFRCFLFAIPPEFHFLYFTTIFLSKHFSLLIFSLFLVLSTLMIKSRGLIFIYCSTCFCRSQLQWLVLFANSTILFQTTFSSSSLRRLDSWRILRAFLAQMVRTLSIFDKIIHFFYFSCEEFCKM